MRVEPDLLAAEQAAADAALRQAADALLRDVPHPLADPVRYALAGGGKRLRPILCAASYRALGGRSDAIHALGAAIEIIHTYSLVHDDLPCMDDDDLRRGRATTHRAYDVRIATVAGAFMIPLAIRQVLRAADALGLPDAARPALVRELTTSAGAAGMVGGQWLDLDGEGRMEAGWSRVSDGRGPDDALVLDGALERLTLTHRRKTGALMAASLAMGAIAAGADSGVVAAVRAAGEELGLAFQIHDDVLDETATADVLGKSIGKDEAAEKATYTRMLGVVEARRRAHRAMLAARDTLTRAGVRDPALLALVTFAVERDR